MYSKIINVCWLHGCLCIHAQFSVCRKSSGNVCQVTVQLTSIKHISFPVSFTSLSQESLLTWFMFLVPYIPTLSSVSSGSFGSAFSPIEIISIPSFLSSWKTSCHPTSFLKIYSIFFRTQITMACHCQWLAQYLCPEASPQWLAPFVTHPIIFQNCQLQQASPLLTVPSVAIVSFILLCN